jgi:hypothetical protein
MCIFALESLENVDGLQIEKHGSLMCIDIRQMLISMRQYRMGLIQTPDQLRFSYLCVIQGGYSILGQDANSNITVRRFSDIVNNLMFPLNKTLRVL